jgi:putative endonuclease
VVGVANNRRIGTLGERIAEALLMLKGYKVLRRNYRVAGREIDLLVQRHDCIVAVEVKLRQGRSFGMAVEAIDDRKLARIRFALAGALQEQKSGLRPRVDAVVIDLTDDATEMTVRHLEAVA